MRGATHARRGAASLFMLLSMIGTVLAVSPPARAEVQTATIATGTADASGTLGRAWQPTPITSPITGSVTFDLDWSGSGDLDMSIKTLPDKTLIANNVGTDHPKSMTVDLIGGNDYQLAVWAQTGVGTYTLTMTYDDGTSPGGETMEIADSRADATNATAPKWASHPFAAPVTGEVEFVLSWDTASADLRFTVKNPSGTVIASNLTSGPGPKAATADLTLGVTYRFNIWAYSGASDYLAVITYGDEPPPPPPDDRPNIVFVNTDDQRPETIAFLDDISGELAALGTTYTNAYVTTPACCPSRASVMSGRYVHNNGQLQQLTPGFDFDASIQRYLHDAGYFTGHAGKFLHWWDLSDGVAPYWDRWTYFKGGYEDVWMRFDDQTLQSDGYSTTIVFDRAIEYLDDFEQRDDATPWFLQLTPIAPHAPSIPEPVYADAAVPPYDPNPATAETDRSDKPVWVTNNHHTVESVDESRTQMIRTLYTVDDQVGRLVAYLEAHDEMDNTLFIFTSDNGYTWAEHGLIEKFLPYTPSVAVPLVMRWDGVIDAGATDDRLVAHIDLTATMLEAAGIDTSTLAVPLDGHDILGGYVREVALTEYWQDDRNIARIPTWASITTATYQYTEYYDPENLAVVVFREYYDMVADPYQLENLLGDADPGNDPDIGPLSALLQAHRACSGSSCG